MARIYLIFFEMFMFDFALYTIQSSIRSFQKGKIGLGFSIPSLHL